MANLKICPRCGQELENGARFCGKCGAALNEENKKTSDSGIKKTVIIVAAVFAAIAVGSYFAFKPDENGSKSKEGPLNDKLAQQQITASAQIAARTAQKKIRIR